MIIETTCREVRPAGILTLIVGSIHVDPTGMTADQLNDTARQYARQAVQLTSQAMTERARGYHEAADNSHKIAATLARAADLNDMAEVLRTLAIIR